MKGKRILSLVLALCLALSLSIGAFASGEASAETAGGSGEASAETAGGGSGEASGGASGGGGGTNYENRPVFASGVYEMESPDAAEAHFRLYGYYTTTDAAAEDAFTLLPFASGTTAAVYTDSGCGTELAGVDASFDGETLTLSFTAAPADEIFGYVLFDDGETAFTPVPVYVVSFAANEAYLTDTVDYNGYGLRYAGDVYTPGAVYYHDGTADAIIGGAIDLFGAEDFADEIAAAAEEYGYDYDLLYNAVDWYLNNGATTGGDTWQEFLTDRLVNVNPTDAAGPVHADDGYLRVEACYYLFRYYWMNNTTYEVTAGDDVTGIFGDNMNKLYEDFNDFFWGHYYCTWFQALNPALRSGGLFKYDSVVDPDGTNTDETGMYKYRPELGVEGQLPYKIDEVINYGDFLNMIYNALTGGQSALSEKGEKDKEIILGYGDDGRYWHALDILEYYQNVFDAYKVYPNLDQLLDEPVSKWDAVVLYYLILPGTSDAAKEVPDDNTEDVYLYNTTKHGTLAKDTYLDTDTYYARKGIEDYTAETNHYGLTTMAAVTVTPKETVDADEWSDCMLFGAGPYFIIFDDTAILDTYIAGEKAGYAYYRAGYSAAEYGGEKEYRELAFSWELDGETLIISGIEGYPSFASGTTWNLADVGSFYCSGLWIRDGVKAELRNTTVLAQASGSGDDIRDDAHRFFGGGDGLQVTDKDTAVTVENDNGQIFLIGTGSTAAGSIYAGEASTTIIRGTTLRNASGHPFSIFYNGVLVLDNDSIMNSGRIFNSDASSGAIIFNDVIAVENSGASVMDETCSAYFTDTFVTKLSGWEVNGNAQAVLTNTTVETGGSFNFSNKTSMTSDVGEVVLVNSKLLNTSGKLFNATRGGRGYVHVVDSTVNWSGDVDTVLLAAAGPNSYTGSCLYVEVDEASDFPTAFSVQVAGDCYESVRGWNDDVISYDSNSTLYLDIDKVIDVKMDCASTVTCAFGMVGVTDKFHCTGNVIFAEDGSYIYTGLDEDGGLYSAELITVRTDNSDGTCDVTYTMPDGSTMTYLNLPVTA